MERAHCHKGQTITGKGKEHLKQVNIVACQGTGVSSVPTLVGIYISVALQGHVRESEGICPFLSTAKPGR